MIKQTITVEWDSQEEIEDEKDFEIVINTWIGEEYYTESVGEFDTLTEAIEVANNYRDDLHIIAPVRELVHS